MAQQSLSTAEAILIFAALTGLHPQSAKELKNGYRIWIKTHHPDVTGKRDSLSLESVQWMNAAYDVLKKYDWIITEPPSAEASTDNRSPDWTDVDKDDRHRRWREEQQRKRREEEEQQKKRAEEIRRRNEELKNRPFRQKILGGSNDLEYPGCGLVGFIVGIPISIALIILILKIYLGTFFKLLHSGFSELESGDWVILIIVGLAGFGFTQSLLLGLWKSLRKFFETA